MSDKYPDLSLTDYPDKIDQRKTMIDPSSYQDIAVIKAFQSAMESGDFGAAATLIESNERLEKMVFNAAKWDRHEDMIIALQRLFKENIGAYIAELTEALETGASGFIMPDGKTLADKAEEWDKGMSQQFYLSATEPDATGPFLWFQTMDLEDGDIELLDADGVTEYMAAYENEESDYISNMTDDVDNAKPEDVIVHFGDTLQTDGGGA